MAARMPLETDMAPAEPDILSQRYRLMERVGEGTYGTVYKAIERSTGRTRAIKRIRIFVGSLEEEGVPATALREITMLKDMRGHRHIVELSDVFSCRGKLNLVFEFLDMDLKEYLKRNGTLYDLPLSMSVWQLAEGLAFCHSRRVLHRDLKPQNILVELAAPGAAGGRQSRIRRLVLADFGLARDFSVPLKKYTHDVVTLWYRPPEILLGQMHYGPSTDVWSLGCIVAEMATNHPLFPGDSEIDTIFKIFQVIGTPDDSMWPGCETLRDWKRNGPKWRNTDFRCVRETARGFGEDGVDFLRSCLHVDHVKRWSASKLRDQHMFLETARSPPTGAMAAMSL